MTRSLLVLALASCWAKPGVPIDDGVDDPVHFAAGNKHVCWIRADSKLACWGNNEHLQLGRIGEIAEPSATVDDNAWDHVAAGANHTCGLRNGEVYCWGDDRRHQTQFTGDTTSPVTLVDIGGRAEKIFAGADASCAIDDAGHLTCWGQIDPLAAMPLEKPTRIKPGNVDGPWRSVAITTDHACALRDGENKVYCWGKSNAFQLGVMHDRAIDGASAKQDREFVAIRVAPGVTCGITLDRELVCFGSPARGHLGDTAMDALDRVIDSSHRWSDIAVGPDHVCGSAEGVLFCYGDNERGALGSGVFEARRTIGAPLEDAVARHVVAGESFSCAISGDTKWCWGANEFGELGLGADAIASSRTPVVVADLANLVVSLVATGRGHTCAIAQGITGPTELYCWGDNRDGQVTGTPNMPSGYITRPIKITRPVAKGIALGGAHTCLSEEAQPRIQCWGRNTEGQVGAGMFDLATIGHGAGGGQWLSLSAGNTTTCAVAENTVALCWGELPGDASGGKPVTAMPGNYHMFSVGDRRAVAATATGPEQVVVFGASPDTCVALSQDSTAKLVFPGSPNAFNYTVTTALDGAHACALEDVSSTAHLACWGVNTAGQTAQPASPCVMPQYGNVMHPRPPDNWNVSRFRVMALAGDHTCVVDSSDIVWCWGANHHGELGDLDTSDLPRRLSLEAYSDFGSGPFHTCAIERDSRHLVCWGENRYGELGNGRSYQPKPQRLN